jgi:hypothetical protein
VTVGHDVSISPELQRLGGQCAVTAGNNVISQYKKVRMNLDEVLFDDHYCGSSIASERQPLMEGCTSAGPIFRSCMN